MNLATLLALLDGFPPYEQREVIRRYRLQNLITEEVALEAEKRVRK